MKTEKQQALTQLIEEYMLMTEAIVHSNKKARQFGTDVDIFRSEIHIIYLVGENEGLHISDIARKFGVTKGAISQLVKKLEKKDLVWKQRDPSNQTRLLVHLTDKGWIAFRAHNEYHEKHDKEMYAYLEGASEADLALLRGFVKQVTAMTPNHEDSADSLK